jgi:hypothetical protein
MTQQQPQYPRQPRRPRSRAWWLVFLGIFVFLIVITIGNALKGSHSSSSSSGAAGTQQTVTVIVTGDDEAQVTYGPAGTNLTGTAPMEETAVIPSDPPAYYSVQAQLQGGGEVSCEIEVDGKVISQATATGGYNIASCEIGQDPLTGQWEDDN